jgi:phage shock protein C
MFWVHIAIGLNSFGGLSVIKNTQSGGDQMKRLYRSRKNKVIAGVCGGIAEYLEVDPVLIRIIAVVLLFVGGGSLIAYIIGMIIIPDESKIAAQGFEPASNLPLPPSGAVAQSGRTGGLIVGIIMLVLGLTFLLRNIPFFRHYYWWFWDMGWNFFWPSLLIVIGGVIILRAMQKD